MLYTKEILKGAETFTSVPKKNNDHNANICDLKRDKLANTRAKSRVDLTMERVALAYSLADR